MRRTSALFMVLYHLISREVDIPVAVVDDGEPESVRPAGRRGRLPPAGLPTGALLGDRTIAQGQ